ncbi:unnamed protein product [Musa textilis]
MAIPLVTNRFAVPEDFPMFLLHGAWRILQSDICISLTRNDGKTYQGSQSQSNGSIEADRKDSCINEGANLVKEDDQEFSTNQENILLSIEVAENQIELPLLSIGNLRGKRVSIWHKMKETLHRIVDELVGSTNHQQNCRICCSSNTMVEVTICRGKCTIQNVSRLHQIIR